MGGHISILFEWRVEKLICCISIVYLLVDSSGTPPKKPSPLNRARKRLKNDSVGQESTLLGVNDTKFHDASEESEVQSQASSLGAKDAVNLSTYSVDSASGNEDVTMLEAQLSNPSLSARERNQLKRKLKQAKKGGHSTKPSVKEVRPESRDVKVGKVQGKSISESKIKVETDMEICESPGNQDPEPSFLDGTVKVKVEPCEGTHSPSVPADTEADTKVVISFKGVPDKDGDVPMATETPPKEKPDRWPFQQFCDALLEDLIQYVTSHFVIVNDPI
jgi:hypothetical protein